MIVLGPEALFYFTSVTFALLLVRGTFGAEKTSKIATTSPWFPSGPPPTKPPADTTDALQKILPSVTFNCKGKTGYFPDSTFNCEVFHYCQPDGARNTFICPSNSIFNQLSMVCEEKTQFNTRICKEGSIGPKKERQKSSKPSSKVATKKKYKEDISKQHRMSPSLVGTNNSKTTPGYVMALEELLSYMNYDQQAKTIFDPNVHIEKNKPIPNRSLVKPTATMKSVHEKKLTASSLPSGSLKTSEKTNVRKFSRILSNTSFVGVDKDIMQASESKLLEDFSIEHDAIEGRRYRKHKRVGRVLDVEDVPLVHTKGKRSHVSARSPTDSPPDEDLTKATAHDTASTPKSTTAGSPSLFSADRSKAKDFRKRRRNLNRRRKMQTANETTTTENGNSESTTTVQSTRQDTGEHNRQKTPQLSKDHFEGEISLSWLGMSKSGKVEPYTLPPLPIPDDVRLETTTQAIGINESIIRVKKKRPDKDTRTRRPWYTTTPIPSDDYLEVKFGEKISELAHHHYGSNLKTDNNPTEHIDMSAFEDIVPGEYNERSPQSKPKSERTTGMSNSKNDDDKKLTDTDEKMYRHYSRPEDLFPPPRAEPRELKGDQRQQLLHIYDTNADSTNQQSIFSEEERATTEDPFKSTNSYFGKTRYRSRGQPEKDGMRWRLSEDKRKRKEKKVEVGSTFDFHTASPVSTTEPPVTDSATNRKELPKINTSAHQHLLKLMNDFFALSSTSSQDSLSREGEHFEDMVTPTYRGSEEDMHRGESITEDIEELPSELLDVVEFIAGQSEEDKKTSSADDSHEIIKISGPITDKHLKEILSDNEFDSYQHRKKQRHESYKKIVVVPSENKENLKDIADVAQFASLRLEPFLKQMASDKTSVTVIPRNPESQTRRQPAVLTAKKIPVRVFYKDQVGESTAHRTPSKSNLKVIRSRLPNPSLQVIQNGRIAPTRSYSQPYPKSKPHHLTQQPVILHPKSIYPPHPPPLPKKTLPFKFGFPFVSGNGLLMNNMRYIPHRKKRSTLNRNRRQLQHNPHFLPLPRPVFPTFNPKFVPTFAPFKNLFSSNGINSAGSNLSPFIFPKFEVPRPPFGAPPVFKLHNSPPAPVRHVTQAGDQTVIVEEVPVPIHVEVPDPNLLRPIHLGNSQQNILNPFPSNQFRNPSPPAIQTPPLLQGFQGRFPVTNNYRPFGMPSNVPPPVMHYQPSLQFSQALPPSITNQGQLYALGVTTKPFPPSKPPPVRIPNGVLGAPGIPPGQPQNFQVHANSYPNYPYFQGAFTTPITTDSVPGRLMYSGYKPPKSTVGTKLPRTASPPNRERKVKPPPPRPRPTQTYFHVTKGPTQEQHTNYQVPNTRGRTQLKSNLEDIPRENLGVLSPRPYSSNGTPPLSENPVPPRRRPNRKRRPRPQITTTTPSIHIFKDISPTPPPPEQIPPPPADFTAIPLQHEVPNSLQSIKETSKAPETSSLYPPAGYYGKDQLVQFFDSSAKSYKKASTQKPYEHNDLGEQTSSAELDESIASLSSGEDSNQPAFGTRLKGAPENQRRKRKRQPVQSPTQKSEVRMRPNNRPDETENRKRPYESSDRKPTRHQERDDNANNQRRPRPPQYRARSRPMSVPSRKPEVHHYKYDGNTGGFYSVPSGLQSFVDPSQRPPQGPGSTDMFGIPHPTIDQSIYSLRPQGASGDFNSNFFSVPAAVAQQQQSKLHNMNIKPIPESARDFFEAAAKESSNYKNAETSEKKEQEEQSSPSDAAEEKTQQRNPAVRKLRKPKRKNRYNPRNNEEKQSSGINSDNSHVTPVQRNTLNSERTTQVTTTAEPRSTYSSTESSSLQNDIKEQQVIFKPRAPLLPKALPDLSKLQNGKIDFKKLNATISTSVSVSGAFNQQPNNTSSEDSSNKRVFSSQNGGLAVVRNNPKRKRTKQKIDRFGSNEESSAKAKYDIAASVLDIIKATTDSEKQSEGFYSNRYGAGESPSGSKLSNVWNTDPTRIDYNRTESR